LGVGDKGNGWIGGKGRRGGRSEEGRERVEKGGGGRVGRNGPPLLGQVYAPVTVCVKFRFTAVIDIAH